MHLQYCMSEDVEKATCLGGDACGAGAWATRTCSSLYTTAGQRQWTNASSYGLMNVRVIIIREDSRNVKRVKTAGP